MRSLIARAHTHIARASHCCFFFFFLFLVFAARDIASEQSLLALLLVSLAFAMRVVLVLLVVGVNAPKRRAVFGYVRIGAASAAVYCPFVALPWHFAVLKRVKCVSSAVHYASVSAHSPYFDDPWFRSESTPSPWDSLVLSVHRAHRKPSTVQ